jgi:glyoxylase-like metal-dependent hydrolase (beta-lactamase superfamily II)
MSDLPNYEVYAIRYATRASKRSDNFVGGDPHDGPMPLDYFVWAAIGPDRSYVIDTGFTAEIAAKRKRDYLRCPIESLKLIGLDPGKISDVILTHLHYDHVGNFDKLPAANFHLQETELHYAVGRYMRYKKLQHSYEIEDVVGMVRANYASFRRESPFTRRRAIRPACSSCACIPSADGWFWPPTSRISTRIWTPTSRM